MSPVRRRRVGRFWTILGATQNRARLRFWITSERTWQTGSPCNARSTVTLATCYESRSPMEFERRTSSYFHLTTWQADALQIGGIYSTSWAESNYWSSQNKLDAQAMQTELERQSLSNSPLSKMFAKPLALLKAKAQQKKEVNAERIRSREFAERPSRKNCLFLCESETQLRTYMSRYGYKILGRNILEVELLSFEEPPADIAQMRFSREEFDVLNVPNRHRANPRYLDCNTPGPEQEAMLRAYWRGEETEREHLTEVLFRGFFRITTIIERG